MESENHSQPFLQTHSRPLVYSATNSLIAIANEPNALLLLDPALEHPLTIPSLATDRTLSLKLTPNLLVRGGNEGHINIWDMRQPATPTHLHSFHRPGCKFKAIDVSEHILAAAYGKKVVFWDLRKMKQRAEFTDSFNDEVTALRFSQRAMTELYGCSSDGLVARFDLTEKNEEDALIWGHQMLESPCRLDTSHDILLVETQDQVLLTFYDESVKDRYEVRKSHPSAQIVKSWLDEECRVHYITQDMKLNTVDYWVNGERTGHLPTPKHTI